MGRDVTDLLPIKFTQIVHICFGNQGLEVETATNWFTDSTYVGIVILPWNVYPAPFRM